MRLKDASVSTRQIRPELVIALMVADSVYREYGKELVVTSLNDARHKHGSLHYSGSAADLRTHYFTTSELEMVYSELRASLSDDYDVVLEGDHIHLEYQPKRAEGPQ